MSVGPSSPLPLSGLRRSDARDALYPTATPRRLEDPDPAEEVGTTRVGEGPSQSFESTVRDVLRLANRTGPTTWSQLGRGPPTRHRRGDAEYE